MPKATQKNVVEVKSVSGSAVSSPRVIAPKESLKVSTKVSKPAAKADSARSGSSKHQNETPAFSESPAAGEHKSVKSAVSSAKASGDETKQAEKVSTTPKKAPELKSSTKDASPKASIKAKPADDVSETPTYTADSASQSTATAAAKSATKLTSPKAVASKSAEKAVAGTKPGSAKATEAVALTNSSAVQAAEPQERPQVEAPKKGASKVAKAEAVVYPPAPRGTPEEEKAVDDLIARTLATVRVKSAPIPGLTPRPIRPQMAPDINPDDPYEGIDELNEGQFLYQQILVLDAEREHCLAQAAMLRAEADQLAIEMEPGDVQFDDESGEGSAVNVERERDLAMSASAIGNATDIERVLHSIEVGTYGYCESCKKPIVRDRLRAVPTAKLCVACKSGGLSRR